LQFIVDYLRAVDFNAGHTETTVFRWVHTTLLGTNIKEITCFLFKSKPTDLLSMQRFTVSLVVAHECVTSRSVNPSVGGNNFRRSVLNIGDQRLNIIVEAAANRAQYRHSATACKFKLVAKHKCVTALMLRCVWSVRWRRSICPDQDINLTS